MRCVVAVAVLDRSEPQCLLIVTGDVLGGSAMCEQTRGKHVIEILNLLECDVCVVGNHEVRRPIVSRCWLRSRRPSAV